MAGKSWKYAEAIAVFDGCPPNKLEAKSRAAFRFVHSDASDERNFLPVAMIPGALYPNAPPCCTDYSLSFFDNRDKAVARFRELTNRNRQFAKRSGGCIAKVTISAVDGESGKVSKKSSHFEFFEYASANLVASMEAPEEVNQ